MKTLVAVPSDPISVYEAKGRSSYLADYYNPCGTFDRVSVLSPFEEKPREAYGLQIEPCAWRDFARRIAELEADLVHAYGGYWAADYTCYNKVAGIPVVVSVHDTNPKLLFESISEADQVWCTTQAVKASVQRKLRVADERIRICPNGVDLRLFTPGPADPRWSRLLPAHCRWKLIHVGRRDPQKNIDTLLRALLRIPDSVLVQIGQGRPDEMIWLAEQVGVADRVIFLESVPNEELPGLYNCADCVVAASRWEGYGIALVEALACGAAVVTSNRPPMSDFVRDGVNGVLVNEPDDADELAGAIRRVLTDSRLRAAIRLNAPASVADQSIECAYAIKAELYRQILDEYSLQRKFAMQMPLTHRTTREAILEVRLELLERALEESDAARAQLLDENATLRQSLDEHVAREALLEARLEAEVELRERAVRDAQGARAQLLDENATLRQSLDEHRAQQAILEGRLEELRNCHSTLISQAFSKRQRRPPLRRFLAQGATAAFALHTRTLIQTLLSIEKLIAAFVKWRRGLSARESWLMTWYGYAFDRFKRERIARYGSDLSGFRCPSVEGLVSVVLPAYNGADMVAESIESVLGQTHRNLELLIINDGSSDATGEIADAYAARDCRVKVVHQENQKIPRTLNAGFDLARGEFLTWTSCDNRMKPDFVARMVGSLRRHPDWDAVYANLDIIDDEGNYLRNSTWYEGDQNPPGSEHIWLRADTSELNTWPNNFVGAAFMYRDRTRRLIGGYSPIRYTVEDYDYWMRVNALLTLRHADFNDPVYEYRFHAKSLTSRDRELGITEGRLSLMIFDDFRRDFYRYPLIWVVDCNDKKLAQAVQRRLIRLRHIILAPDSPEIARLPRLWCPCTYIRIATSREESELPMPRLPSSVFRALVHPKDFPPDLTSAAKWDIRVVLGDRSRPGVSDAGNYDWCAVDNLGTLVHSLDILCRSHHLEQIEQEIGCRRASQLRLSVVVCSYRRVEHLKRAVTSLAEQTLSRSEYEVIVVNNAPDEPIDEVIGDLRRQLFDGDESALRLVVCPIKGLSYARNAGVSEARGEIVTFMDDDGIADRHCLAEIVAAFDSHQDFGVIGGKVVLNHTRPTPNWLKPDWAIFWSQYSPNCDEFTEVKQWWDYPYGANWSARRSILLRIGGFRCSYGRIGKGYSGGEEIVAAAKAAELGHKIGFTPRACVVHDVESERFTLNHVRRTVRAGVHTMYQMQRDLHILMGLDLWHTGREILKLAKHIFAFRGPGLYDRLLALFQLEAYVLLARRQIEDRIARAKEPVSKSRLTP